MLDELQKQAAGWISGDDRRSVLAAAQDSGTAGHHQAAAMVHKSKRTLERFKTNGTFPTPAVEGGGGRADLFDWKPLRLWLVGEFRIALPERYPTGRES